MNFKQRCQLAREGKFVLRVQMNGSGTYHVAYQTPKGGWAIYNKAWTKESRQFCETVIAQLVRKDSTKFFIDDDLI